MDTVGTGGKVKSATVLVEYADVNTLFTRFVKALTFGTTAVRKIGVSDLFNCRAFMNMPKRQIVGAAVFYERGCNQPLSSTARAPREYSF